MCNRVYEEVNMDEEQEDLRIKLSWTIFLRQIYVVSGVWVIYFSLGLSFGAPTVLIQQIRREANSSDAVSHEMESWITSVHGYSALPFVVVIPVAAQRFGRKIPFLLIGICTLVAYIVFLSSTTTLHILISEVMQGVLLGSNITLMIPICSEYASQQYRGIFLAIKSSCFFWGVWVANFVGTFFYWKNIGIIGVVCCAYTPTAIYWPESPSWLAMRGRYQEATDAHHWLKGDDAVSEKELENLIKSQKEYQEIRKKYAPKNYKDMIRLIKYTITTKGYYYPLLMTMTIVSLLHFSGKMVYVMYAIQVIHQMTNSEETAYMGMLLLEGISIVGMTLVCIISKYMKRKTLLISATSIAVLCLYIIALYLYIVSLGIFAEKNIVSLLLLVIFSVMISSIPLMSATIFGEIVPLRYRCSSLMFLTLYAEVLLSTILKLAPSIFRTLALHGAFLFYAICASILILILVIYLPETKGKSLQEIEDFFKT